MWKVHISVRLLYVKIFKAAILVEIFAKDLLIVTMEAEERSHVLATI